MCIRDRVRDDLALEEITRGLAPGSSSPTTAALVATPPASSTAPATSLLGATPAGQTGGGGAVDIAGDRVVVVALVALLLVAPVRVEAVGARRHRLRLPLLPLEVRPGHPSLTHGQGASRCGRSRVREGRLVLSSSRRPCSLALLHSSRRPGPRPLSPASSRPGLGVGPGRSGAVLQHHETDAADQHRVDRRLGCLVPHHSRCWYPLFCPTPTPLLSFFYHGW